MLLGLREDGTAVIFDTFSGNQQASLARRLTEQEARIVSFSPNGETVFTGRSFCELATLREKMIDHSPMEGVLGASFSADSSKLLVRTNKQVYIYDVNYGTMEASFPSYDLNANLSAQTWHDFPPVATTQMAPTGHACALCNADATLLAADILVDDAHSPNRKSSTRYVQVWDTQACRQGPRVEGFGPLVSPDGTLFAASRDSGIVLWDMPPRSNSTVFATVSIVNWTVCLALGGYIFGRQRLRQQREKQARSEEEEKTAM
jgi:WD40 repeat protein